MTRPLQRLAPLLFIVLLAGCSSSAPTASDAPAPAAASDSVQMPARPIPNVPEPERGFQAAIEADTRTERGEPGPNYWQQEARYDLTARVRPDARRLEGSGQITYVNHSPDTLGQLYVELAQNLHQEGVIRNEPAEVTGGVEVERVAVDGATLHLAEEGPRYQVMGTQLVLVPETALPPGASTTIEIDWAFPIPQAGAGGRMGYSDDLVFLAYWYPQMSVYDDVTGWMTEPFMGRAEFYADFADYDLTVEAPEGWIVAATGTLQNPDAVLAPEVAERMRRAHASDTPVQVLGPDETGTAEADTSGRLQWRFRAEQVRDVAFSLTRNGYWEAARTPVGDRDGDGATDYTAINTFYRPTAPLWSEVTRYQQHAISFFSEHTGHAYPWPHMTAVEGGGIIGGGMEFPMMTLMGDYNGRSDSALYAVTAHELAHMWVPMIVSTNERRYSWIDEGTTTFNENDARTDFYPNSTAIRTDRMSYLQVARADLEGPIMRWSNFHYTPLAFGVASYPKPASLLVALRGLLGEETFREAYHRFIDTWAYKHPYPHDLFNTFEAVSGRNLDWFWDSWYYETWTLDQAIADVQQDDDGSATVHIADRGEAPMPVRLTVTRANGSAEQHTVPVTVWLEGATETTLDLPAGPAIERVEIDADRHFPDIDRGNNAWARGEATAPTSSN